MSKETLPSSFSWRRSTALGRDCSTALLRRNNGTASRSDEGRRANGEFGSAAYSHLVEDRMEIDLYRALGDPEPRGDVAIAEALPDQLDQLALSRGQQRQRRYALPGGIGPVDNLRIDPGLTLEHPIHALQQKRGVRSLQHDSVWREVVGRDQLRIVEPRGQEDDRTFLPAAAQLAKDVDARPVRHVDVEEHQVRLHLVDLGEGFLAAPSPADQLIVGPAKQHSER